MAPLLVSLCLFRADDSGRIITNGQGKPVPVPLATINRWPGRVVDALFDGAKRLSQLGEYEPKSKQVEDDSKNSPGSTTDGTGSPENSGLRLMN